MPCAMTEEKKIIIDEDWKSQVQAEKEALQDEAKTQATGPSAPPGDYPMPAASFEMLLTTLATEAMIALGQVPHPATGKVVTDRNQAKYLIDMIDLLREKTKGNLTPQETQLIDLVLHQLRMAFVGLDTPSTA